MIIPQQFLDSMRRCKVEHFQYFESVGSTNQVAMEWLEQSAPDSSIVFADHQSSGRGRFDRRWITEPKSAIAVSIVLRPEELEHHKLSFFSPLAAVALSDVLEKKYHIQSEIKWPNDVLINRKKTSGILTELSWNGDHLAGIVIGVGINVLETSLPPEPNLNFPATYLQAHTNEPIDRYQFLADFLQAFFYWRPKIHSQNFINYWTNRLAFRGEKVYIKQKDGKIQLSGTLKGISQNGDLELISEGQLHSIAAGDVHLRPVTQEN